MKLSLAIQTPDVTKQIPVALLSGDFSEKLTTAASLGVEGVELMTADPSRLDLSDICANLEKESLEVSAVGSGAVSYAAGLTLLHDDPIVTKLAINRLEELIQFAARVGSPLVTIGSFRGWASKYGSNGRDRLIQILGDAASFAADEEVRIAIEPLNRYETDLIFNVEEGLQFINEVHHPALGLLLDTFHMNIEERSWALPLRVASEAGVLWHIHLGDNNRLPPGQGMIEFPALIQLLRDLNYSDYLSAELLPVPNPDEAARQTVAFMRKILQV